MVWLLALSAVCLFLAQHSFVTYPLSLKFLRWLNPRQLNLNHESTGHFAICVCAYNEEAVIEKKLENLSALKARHPDLQILIYIDAATDRTAEIVNRYKDRFFVHIAEQRYGKTYGMNLLVGQVSAPYIIFSDANVLMDMDAIDNLKKYFSDPAVGCVCGHLIYTNDADGVTAQSGSLYWKMEEKLKQLESDTGSVMGADGSIFAIRKSLHQPPPANIIDDMFVSLGVLCQGYRIIRASDVRAYEKTVFVSSEEFRRKVRIACQAFNVHRLMWPRLKKLSPLDLYKYVSHKLLRWFTIYFLAWSAFFFVIALVAKGYGWVTIILLSAATAVFAWGKKSKIKPVMQFIDILSAFAGVGMGVWKSLRGEKFQTWAPAQSIRQTQK